MQSSNLPKDSQGQNASFLLSPQRCKNHGTCHYWVFPIMLNMSARTAHFTLSLLTSFSDSFCETLSLAFCNFTMICLVVDFLKFPPEDSLVF
jgi:hypothetical protein